MTSYPEIRESVRVEMLEYPGREQKIDLVLDTDAATEVDDPFAIAYAMLSPDRFCVRALYAAPFAMNDRACDPAVGMEMSYQEILNVMWLAGVSRPDCVFRGSTRYLQTSEKPEASPAALDLIARAKTYSPTNPLYVAAIGAGTNIANAILLEPEMIRNLVIVWLAGDDPSQTPNTYNVYQDVRAAQVIFDCGVPLVFMPCNFVSSHLITSMPELHTCLDHANPLCEYLVDIVGRYGRQHFAWGKQIWDLAAIGYLMDAGWSTSALIPSPIITPQLTYSFDPRRHLIRAVRSVSRDDIFRDCFTKLRNAPH